jgi:hypothetical protein
MTARLGLFFIEVTGGFTMRPAFSLDFVSASDLGRNVAGVFFGVLTLSGGYVFGHNLMQFDTLVSMIRVAGVALMITAVSNAIRQGLTGPEGWGLRFVLALSVLINITSCLVSAYFAHALSVSPSIFDGGASVRFLPPAILFGGVLTALELPRMLRSVRSELRRWVLISLCGAALVMVAGLFAVDGFARWKQKPAIAQQREHVAGQWLLDHGLTRGVGSYWEAMSITALSGQQVSVRAELAVNGRLEPYIWVTNLAWYKDKRRPQFVIFVPGNEFGITMQTIANTYGQPADVEHVAEYDIAVLASADR